jgi:UPF0755 protein
MKISQIRAFTKKHLREGIFLLVFFVLFYWVFISSAPRMNHHRTLVEIEEGMGLKEISNLFEENNLIRSKIVFDALLIIRGKDDEIVAGEYLFEGRNSVFNVVDRIIKGDYGIETKTIILKEGFTLEQMAFILSEIYERIDYDEFLELTEGKEGYLFPDTYIFPENVTSEKVIETLEKTFKERVDKISNEINNSPYSFEEIITMASIIEKESTKEARQEVSNILWKRIEIGMALQVDATFVYERDKGTFDLTKADLQKDSPYNTYTNTGLPPTPISNPGIESIKAAANPQPTENLYFLTGYDGEMYYAETHDGHVRNKSLYLN